MTDNLPRGLERSTDVASDDLEHALREMFSRSLTMPPTGADPAGRALRRARRIQRRRSAVGLTMAAVATVSVTVFAVQLAAPGPSEPVPLGDPFVPPSPMASPAVPPDPPASPAEALEIDVVADGVLRTAEGQLVDLSDLGRVVAAHRSADTWLMVTANPAGLWRVRAGSSPQPFLAEVDDLVLAPDARRVAWRQGDRLFAATVEADQLGTPELGPVAPGTRLVRFVGEGVLISRSMSAGNLGHSIWWPSEGTGELSSAESVTAVYGILPDGQTVVGQTTEVPGHDQSATPCLALFDRHLTPARAACDPVLSLGSSGVVSPDGRWLIANATPGSDVAGRPSDPFRGQALVVDLRTVFGPTPVVAALDFPLAGDVIWEEPDTMVHADRRGNIVRVRVRSVADGTVPQVEQLRAPADLPDGPLVLVRCGAATPTTAAVSSCR